MTEEILYATDYDTAWKELLSEKGWGHDEKLRVLKFLETMAKIRKPELKQEYVGFLREKTKEEKKTMLIIEELAIKQGRKEGMSIGEQRGRNEGKLETAHRMVNMGLPVEIISQATGLTEAEFRS